MTAQQFADGLPPPPTIRPPRLATAASLYNRTTAYHDLLLAAIKSHDLGFARLTARRWEQESAPDLIVHAWLNAGQVAEEISFTHELKAPSDRAKMLLVIAQFMLDKAGAPNI